ncbi:MAG TPA: glycosyltransferase [Candidatus Binatia bacterium]|nr:glycosyltransferase [Candidatus Binatia bacterium]
MSHLSILYIAYPLLTVSEDSAGGAEQLLLTVEGEMAAAGHHTTVAACDGSRVHGRLLATGAAAGAADQYERREGEHNARILEYLRRHRGEFDLIHDKSGSFFRVAAQCALPVLATLHLPRPFYRQDWFHPLPPNLYFSFVSQSQARSFADLANTVGVVQNGIAVERFPFTPGKDGYVLWLGRICEEKAPHLAIAAARKAGVPLLLAGQVYPFSYHQQYFEREVQPLLAKESGVRFVSAPSARQKLRLLRHARALLLTSTVEETSSLVAIEAMACGTPVLAFRRGAFAEIVADGETGLLVETVDEMAEALAGVGRISPEQCRERVQQHFSASRMAQEYEELYRRVLTSAKEWAA